MKAFSSMIVFICLYFAMVECISPFKFTLLSLKSKKNKSKERLNKIDKTEEPSLDDVSPIDDKPAQVDKNVAIQKNITGLLGAFEIIGPILLVGSYLLIFKLNFDNPIVTKFCRVFFSCYLVGSYVLYRVIKSKIENSESGDIVTVSSGQPGLVKLLGPLVEKFGISPNTNQNNDDTEDVQKMTIKEYDLKIVEDILQQTIPEALTGTYMHFVKKQTRTLLFIAVGGILSKFNLPLVKIHIFGKEATGALARPFKSAMQGMIEKLLNKNSPNEEEAKSTPSGSDDSDVKFDSESDAEALEEERNDEDDSILVKEEIVRDDEDEDEESEAILTKDEIVAGMTDDEEVAIDEDEVSSVKEAEESLNDDDIEDKEDGLEVLEGSDDSDEVIEGDDTDEVIENDDADEVMEGDDSTDMEEVRISAAEAEDGNDITVEDEDDNTEDENDEQFIEEDDQDDNDENENFTTTDEDVEESLAYDDEETEM
jgi:hypothetical protein